MKQRPPEYYYLIVESRLKWLGVTRYDTKLWQAMTSCCDMESFVGWKVNLDLRQSWDMVLNLNTQTLSGENGPCLSLFKMWGRNICGSSIPVIRNTSLTIRLPSFYLRKFSRLRKPPKQREAAHLPYPLNWYNGREQDVKGDPVPWRMKKASQLNSFRASPLTQAY